MIQLRDNTILDPESLPEADNSAYFAADGSVFVSEKGRLGPALTANGGERAALLHGVLQEAAAPREAVLSDWLSHLVRKLVEVAVETAAYSGDWDYSPFGLVPRRRLIPQANFLVGEGMYESWKAWYVRDGILPHLPLVRQGFSEELAQGLDFVPRQLVECLLQRSGEQCHEAAQAVLAEHRARFPASLTERHPRASRLPSWLVHRVLNGMLPSYLRCVPDAENAFDVSYRWNEADFDPDGPYLLPNATARLLVEGEQVRLEYLEFLYPGDGTGTRVTMTGAGAAPAWQRRRAQRAFCSVYLMAAEVDRHIVLGHFLTEFVLVGVRHNLAAEHPIYRLLVPFLQYVDVANHIGDQLVWGKHGVMVQSSAFTESGLQRHFAERMGAFDWKGFTPNQRAMAPSHYAPLVQREFWACVIAYVEDALGELGVADFFPECDPATGAALGPWGEQLHRLSAELEARSVPHHAYDQLRRSALFDATELAFKSEGRSFSRFSSLAELKQLCAFTIYCATLGHGWANVRQYEEGGELEYASFGLRQRVDAPAPADPGDDEAWHREAAPRPCDQANQLLQGFVLSHLPVANLVDEQRGTRPGDELLPDVMSGDASLGARVARLKAKIEELARCNPTGAPDVYCDADMIPARPNA